MSGFEEGSQQHKDDSDDEVKNDYEDDYLDEDACLPARPPSISKACESMRPSAISALHHTPDNDESLEVGHHQTLDNHGLPRDQLIMP